MNTHELNRTDICYHQLVKIVLFCSCIFERLTTIQPRHARAALLAVVCTCTCTCTRTWLFPHFACIWTPVGPKKYSQNTNMCSHKATHLVYTPVGGVTPKGGSISHSCPEQRVCLVSCHGRSISNIIKLAISMLGHRPCSKDMHATNCRMGFCHIRQSCICQDQRGRAGTKSSYVWMLNNYNSPNGLCGYKCSTICSAPLTNKPEL